MLDGTYVKVLAGSCNLSTKSIRDLGSTFEKYQNSYFSANF